MECFAGSCGEQLRVVELALIGDHVCVGARSRDQIIVPDPALQSSPTACPRGAAATRSSREHRYTTSTDVTRIYRASKSGRDYGRGSASNFPNRS